MQGEWKLAITDESISIPGSTLSRITREVFKKRGIDLDQELWSQTNALLQDTVSKGMGIEASIDYADNRYATLQRMKRNVATFAAFKNHQNIASLVGTLKGENGKLRNWSSFKLAADKINKKYNKNWLHAEYDTATRSAKMARKWADFERDSDVYPNLRYVTQQDDRVREDHAVLNNTVLPLNHPFWDQHFPPNGWRCRCDVIQTSQEADEAYHELPDKDVPAAFRNNAGKHGKVFTEAHPYFSIDELGGHRVLNQMRSFSVKDDASYTDIASSVDGKNTLSAHFDTKGDDIQNHMEYALQFMEMGHSVKILPSYSAPKGIKWPDLLLDNSTLIEAKKIIVKNEDSLFDRLKSASKQLNKNIYGLNGYALAHTDSFDNYALNRLAKRYWGTSSRTKFYVYRGNEMYVFEKGKKSPLP